MIKDRSENIRQEILKFVSLSIKRRGFPPTEREIADYFNFSQGTAHYHLKLLKASGVLKFRYGKAKRNSRGIKIRKL